MKRNWIFFIFAVCLGMLGPIYSFGGGTPAWSYKFGNISAVSMSSDGMYVIVGCSDGYYYVFDSCGSILRSDDVGSEIHCVDIAQNSNFVIGTESRYLFLSVIGKSHGSFESKRVLSVDISEDGTTAIVGTLNRIYIVVQGQTRIEIDVTRPTRNTATSSSGDYCVAEEGGRIFIFDFAEGRDRQITSTEETVNTMAISDSGRYLVYGTEEGRIYCYDIYNYELIFRKEIGDSVVDVDISKNGASIVAGTMQGDLYLFELYGKELWNQSIGNSLTVCDLSLSGTFIVVGTINGEMYVLNSTGDKLWNYDLRNTNDHLSISEEGDYLFAASEESLFFFVLKSQSFENTQLYPYSSGKCLECDDLVEAWSQPGERTLQVGDVNGDGKNEIVAIQNNRIKILDFTGKTLWESRKFNDFLRLRELLDVTGDTLLDIIASYYDDEKLFLEFYDGFGHRIKTIELDLGMFEGRQVRYGKDYGAGIYPITLIDADEDGNMELICTLDTDYPLQPRGVISLEYESGNPEWFYPIAPHPKLQVFADIDGDGNQEILLGCDAPCNGIGVGETDDCHAYIFAVNLEGEELWVEEIGDGYRRVRFGVADIDGDETKEIICAAYHANKNWGKLFVLNNRGNLIREDTFDYSLQWGGVADLDANGDKEILIIAFGSDFGELRKYDSKSRIISTYAYGESLNYRSSLIINDLDGDGNKEIVLIPDYPEIIILNKELEELKRLPFPDKIGAISINSFSGCRNDLAILSDRIYIYSYEHEPKQPCFPWVIEKRHLMEEAIEFENEAEDEFQKKNFEQAIEKLQAANEIYEMLKEEEKTVEIGQELEMIKIYREAYAFLTRGLQYFEDEMCEMAIQELEKAKEKLEFLYQNYNRLDEEQKLSEIEELVERCNIISVADAYYDEAVKYYDTGNYEAALENFSTAKDLYREHDFTKNVEITEKKITQVKGIINRKIRFKQTSLGSSFLIILTLTLVVFLRIKLKELRTALSIAIVGIVLGIECSLLYGSLFAFQNVLDPSLSTFSSGFMTALALIMSILAFFGIGIKVKRWIKKSSGDISEKELKKEEIHKKKELPKDLLMGEYAEKISPEQRAPKKKKPNEIEGLKYRLAMGEITVEEYEKLKFALENEENNLG